MLVRILLHSENVVNVVLIETPSSGRRLSTRREIDIACKTIPWFPSPSECFHFRKYLPPVIILFDCNLNWRYRGLLVVGDSHFSTADRRAGCGRNHAFCVRCAVRTLLGRTALVFVVDTRQRPFRATHLGRSLRGGTPRRIIDHVHDTVTSSWALFFGRKHIVDLLLKGRISRRGPCTGFLSDTTRRSVFGIIGLAGDLFLGS
jgi:hypothetical protein